jgi:antitoxin ParD1/3/4
MTVNLTPEQVAWLEKMVADGAFASVDEAARFYIAEAMLHAEDLDLDNLDWAKPLLDEARAELARGEGIPLEEFLRDFREHLAKLRNS